MSQNDCEANGMEPLRLETKDEETYFFNLIQNNSTIVRGQYYIGGLQYGDQWKWRTDFSDIYTGMKWAPNEPNNAYGGENCLSIQLGTVVNTGFNDMICNGNQQRFFCQKPKNAVSKLTYCNTALLNAQQVLCSSLIVK